MGFAIPLLTVMQTGDRVSTQQHLLAMYSIQLSGLARQSQTVLEEQAAAGQAYMAAHKDAEGEVDISAIEYVNSAAFNAKFEARLRDIQAKEQALTLLKNRAEKEIAACNATKESFDKTLDKGISNLFGYGK